MLGGIKCGYGFPSFYTKVSYYRDWIDCIIDKSIEFNNNQGKVEEACKSKAKKRSTDPKDYYKEGLFDKSAKECYKKNSWDGDNEQ